MHGPGQSPQRLRANGKRSKRLLELVPMLYVKGVSQRDMEEALVGAWGRREKGAA